MWPSKIIIQGADFQNCLRTSLSVYETTSTIKNAYYTEERFSNVFTEAKISNF